MKNECTSRGIPKAREVEPIKNPKHIQKVKQYLIGKGSKRDYMLFVMGINVGLRAGDLLSLKLKDVLTEKGIADSVYIYEEKTGKPREFVLNSSAKEAIKTYLQSTYSHNKPNPNDYLFPSQRGNTHLSVDSARKIIKETLRELNIKGNFGSHTLRKTWAYQIYINNAAKNPMILPTLQKMLNHSSQTMTLNYIGITKEVITDIYNCINL
ncbi:integrase [Desulfitispora alkaliphila]|uniref:tyrosine-type recombinase/integrase n=1 Tax=Desulfitispora alkaliphila TaxID=622674 RepID=UPI003D1D2D50